MSGTRTCWRSWAKSQISLTDPDSRAMAAHTHVAVGYNVQIAVDAKHKLIVEQQVMNQVVDMGLLAQNAEPAKEVLGVERITVMRTGAISRSRTSRPARRPGSILTCRVRSVVPRSERACSVKMSSATTQPATASCAQHVNIFIPIRRLERRSITAAAKTAETARSGRNALAMNSATSGLENEGVLDRMPARVA